MDDGSLSQEMATNPIYPYLLQLGGGGIAGIAVGYACKIAFKAAMLLLGVLLVILYALNDVGFITVNWEAIGQGIENGASIAGNWIWTMITRLSVPFVGFGGGLWIGWKKLGR